MYVRWLSYCCYLVGGYFLLCVSWSGVGFFVLFVDVCFVCGDFCFGSDVCCVCADVCRVFAVLCSV